MLERARETRCRTGLGAAEIAATCSVESSSTKRMEREAAAVSSPELLRPPAVDEGSVGYDARIALSLAGGKNHIIDPERARRQTLRAAFVAVSGSKTYPR